MIDGLLMKTGEVMQINADGRSAMMCRQTKNEWTLSSDRWETGVRQLTALITRRDAAGKDSWEVAAMPGKRNPREVATWTVAIDAALKIR